MNAAVYRSKLFLIFVPRKLGLQISLDTVVCLVYYLRESLPKISMFYQVEASSARSCGSEIRT